MSQMEDSQIEKLKQLIDQGIQIVWNPDSTVCRKIVSISSPPKPLDGDEPEPSDCGYFSNGEYVALWNCEPIDFKTIFPIF